MSNTYNLGQMLKDWSFTGNLIWSDSMCVLSWVLWREQLLVFVYNHAIAFQQHSDIMSCYVLLANNPANVASRGCTTAMLFKSEL